MIIKDVLIKAQEGGYCSDWKLLEHSDGIWGLLSSDGMFNTLTFIGWQPEFWRALGKSFGWGQFEIGERQDGLIIYGDEWMERWHKLIDQLGAGRTMEDYFSTL